MTKIDALYEFLMENQDREIRTREIMGRFGLSKSSVYMYLNLIRKGLISPKGKILRERLSVESVELSGFHDRAYKINRTEDENRKLLELQQKCFVTRAKTGWTPTKVQYIEQMSEHNKLPEAKKLLLGFQSMIIEEIALKKNRGGNNDG